MYLTRDQYPHFYVAIKVIAFFQCLLGAALTIDYYNTSLIQEDIVIDKRIEKSPSSGVAYVIVTANSDFTVSRVQYQKIQRGVVLQRLQSRWFHLSKGILIGTNQEGQPIHIAPENIYALDAFFAKLLLASLFALVFVTPSYWMVAITGINIVVVLIFTGLPFLLVFGMGLLVAILIFAFTMWQQFKKPQQM